MPKLGLTMEAGTIVRWLVADGAEVAPGQPVLVIETDKVESEVEATRGGRLHQLAPVGDELPCGATIGTFLAADEQPPTSPAPAAGAAAGAAAGVAGVAPGAAAGVAVSAGVAAGGGPAAGAAPVATDTALAAGAAGVAAGAGPAAGAAPVVGSGATGVAARAALAAGVAPASAAGAAAPAGTLGIGGRLLASPNARRVAAARGVDLAMVVGSGPGGRITSEDVLAAPAPTSSGDQWSAVGLAQCSAGGGGPWGGSGDGGWFRSGGSDHLRGRACRPTSGSASGRRGC